MFTVFAPSFVSAQESPTYTVKEGDTLSEIAETHNTTVEQLAETIEEVEETAPVELYADLKQKLKNGLLKKNQAVATQRQTDVTVHGQLLKNSG